MIVFHVCSLLLLHMQVVEKKEKKAARAQLIADLQSAQLPTEQLQYMHRTADMGKGKETMKQRLRRDLMAERAGRLAYETS